MERKKEKRNCDGRGRQEIVHLISTNYAEKNMVATVEYMRAKNDRNQCGGKGLTKKQIEILMKNDNFDAANLFNTLNIPKIKCNYYYLVAVAWYLQTKNNCNRNTSFRTTKIQKYKLKQKKRVVINR